MTVVDAVAGPLFLRNLRALDRYLPPRSTRSLAVVAALSAIAGLFESAVVVAVGSVATTLGGQGSLSRTDLPILGDVGWLTLIALVWTATLAGLTVRAITLSISTRLSIEPMTRIRRHLVESYFSASREEQQAERVGEVGELLVNQAPRVGLILMNVASAISALTVLIVLAVASLLVDPLTFFVLVAAVFIVVAVTFPLHRMVRRRASLLSTAMLDYSSETSEAVSAAREVQIFNTESVIVPKLHQAALRCAAIIQRVKVLSDLTPILYRSIALALLLSGLAVLAGLGVNDVTTAATVTLLMIRALLESQIVYRAIVNSNEHLPFLGEITKRIERYTGSELLRGEAVLGPVTSAAFRGVDFAYPDAHDVERAALQGVDLAIEPGQRLGIAGVSGAGKSTIVALLLGLMKPTGGEIHVNGRAPREYAADSWAREVAAVPQEPLLLTATVEENVRFFREWVSADDVERAARAAGIHDEILTWSEGYQTVVGEQGSRSLSGGQSQRLCIARALAGNPSLLVLDEPTSALDSAAEQVVADTIAALGDRCMVVVVSHRPVALAACNEIITIADGAVVI